MTRRRFNPTPMVGVVGRSTRAQSVARSSFAPSYIPPPLPRRRAYDDDVIVHGHVPFKPYGHIMPYDTTGSENFTRSEINRELIMTSAAMEDNFDIVNMSRNKDKDVLSRANRAIANTEVHSTPRSAVAARRVMQRGQSTPPDYISKSVTRNTEHQISNHPKPYIPVPVVPAKKKNLLSWEYRIDAYSNPDDLVMVPRSINSVKAQIRDVQDKMDRHKQLMDRYLRADTGLSVDDMRVFVSSVEPPAWPKEERASERIRRRRLKIWRKYHGDE